MDRSLIKTGRLSKSFGATEVVAGIDWTVEAGSIAGIVGPNGAGKTTIIKMLLGMTRPTSGSARVLGYDVVSDSVEIRRQVALVPEDKLLYDEMPVRSFTRFYGSFYPAWDASGASRLLDVWEIPADRPIKELSKGMRAKLVLAAAISRKPRVLLMDEPTIDLDPASVEEILSLIAQWTTEGDRAVVITTHRLEEVERICDSLLLLDRGRSLLQGDLDDIRSAWKRIRAVGVPRAEADIGTWAGVRSVTVTGDLTTVVVSGEADAIAGRLAAGGMARVEIEHMNLRDIFLTLTPSSRGRLDDILESLV